MTEKIYAESDHLNHSIFRALPFDAKLITNKKLLKQGSTVDKKKIE